MPAIPIRRDIVIDRTTANKAPVLRDELAAGFHHPIAQLVNQLERAGTAVATGLAGSYAAATATQILRAVNRPLVLVVPTFAEAQTLAQDMVAFGAGRTNQEVLLLPPPDTSPYSGISPDRNRIMDRICTQFRLAMREGGQVAVIPIESAMRRLVPFRELERLTTILTQGERQLDLQALRRLLVEGGYSAVGLVEDPGTFAIRGGLVDLYCPLQPYPVRLDLFGEEIESIRYFDPQSQRTFQQVESIYIVPVREESLTSRSMARARSRIRAAAEGMSLPSSQISALIEELEEGAPFLSLESLLPAFHDLESPFLAVGEGSLWILFDPPRLADQARELWEQRRTEYDKLREEGEFAFPPRSFYLEPEQTAERLEVLSPRLEIVGPEDDRPCVHTFRCHTNEEVSRLRKMHEGMEGTVHALLGRLDDWRGEYGRVAFACRSEGSAQRLASLLRSYGQPVSITQAPIPIDQVVPPPAGELTVYSVPLSGGFRSPFLSLAVVSDSEIYGRRARRASAKVVEEALAISHFRDLTAGDLVVHLDFGICRYHGMEKLVLDGMAGDYLKLEFAESDKLYLPVHRLGRVQKYLGAGQEHQPHLDRLGSSRWVKSKAKVKQDLVQLADELLKLYADRKSRPGFALSFPDGYFREFEATFPFEETAHQLMAIEEVVADLQAEQPMDRLLCGDVGFGKTEVAIRAAFLAVLGGFQVAVLVPTTVLSEQHLRTFTERLRNFPLRVEALSRFRSSLKAKNILGDLAEGKVDILIGTHRLLSNDVSFRRLGLLIIDEEQRFGVRHKERLKQLKTTVHVLTMSATPIPRTLEMSLLGIRDLSVILTPPSDRLAITTHVAPFKDHVIREGIERELRRGGQVFFVHNRVQGITEVARQIEQIVPEARVAVAHAQMPDTRLERVMLDFVQRKIDVLVCTSIIESGLDITNANTIFINRADTFGLAQLYQLRGRVGRGRERASCYLLVSERHKLPPQAARRLEVIRTHTELSSGISIAQHDLDIRGAGNLLGKDQSGHIRSIGYDLFCELLEETIRERKGEPLPDQLEPEVKLPVEAYLPSEYIREESLRLLFYKRLSMARTADDLSQVTEEMADRFGRLPAEAMALQDVIAIKISLAELGIETVEAGPSAIVFKLSERCRLDPAKVVDLVARTQGRYLLREDMQLVRRLGGKEKTDLLGSTQMVLREIQRCQA
ncbi:MAG: transcription-repair coupling factor [Bradymonadales bacterium]|nr:transcription-repair coupling factor [Bradymonadales bacterium]